MTANGHIPGITRAAYLHSGFMNVYRSGFYHREGKAGAFDRHAGDLYPDEATARRDIDDDARAYYVATVPVQWYEARPVPINPSNSKAKRLHPREERNLHAIPA